MNQTNTEPKTWKMEARKWLTDSLTEINWSINIYIFIYKNKETKQMNAYKRISTMKPLMTKLTNESACTHVWQTKRHNQIGQCMNQYINDQNTHVKTLCCLIMLYTCYTLWHNTHRHQDWNVSWNSPVWQTQYAHAVQGKQGTPHSGECARQPCLTLLGGRLNWTVQLL